MYLVNPKLLYRIVTFLDVYSQVSSPLGSSCWTKPYSVSLYGFMYIKEASPAWFIYINACFSLSHNTPLSRADHSAFGFCYCKRMVLMCPSIHATFLCPVPCECNRLYFDFCCFGQLQWSGDMIIEHVFNVTAVQKENETKESVEQIFIGWHTPEPSECSSFHIPHRQSSNFYSFRWLSNIPASPHYLEHIWAYQFVPAL